MLKTKKYLFVTGASGFIGRNFIKIALKKGFYIFATTRKKNQLNIKDLNG